MARELVGPVALWYRAPKFSAGGSKRPALGDAIRKLQPAVFPLSCQSEEALDEEAVWLLASSADNVANTVRR